MSKHSVGIFESSLPHLNLHFRMLTRWEVPLVKLSFAKEEQIELAKVGISSRAFEFTRRLIQECLFDKRHCADWNMITTGRLLVETVNEDKKAVWLKNGERRVEIPCRTKSLVVFEQDGVDSLRFYLSATVLEVFPTEEDVQVLGTIGVKPGDLCTKYIIRKSLPLQEVMDAINVLRFRADEHKMIDKIVARREGNVRELYLKMLQARLGQVGMMAATDEPEELTAMEDAVFFPDVLWRLIMDTKDTAKRLTYLRDLAKGSEELRKELGAALEKERTEREAAKAEAASQRASKLDTLGAIHQAAHGKKIGKRGQPSQVMSAKQAADQLIDSLGLSDGEVEHEDGAGFTASDTGETEGRTDDDAAEGFSRAEPADERVAAAIDVKVPEAPKPPKPAPTPSIKKSKSLKDWQDETQAAAAATETTVVTETK